MAGCMGPALAVSVATEADRDFAGAPTAAGSRSLFNDDLAVHPRVGRADEIVAARLGERDRLRLALLQHASIPLGLLQLRCSVRDIANIGEGHGGAGFDLCTAWEIAVF